MIQHQLLPNTKQVEKNPLLILKLSEFRNQLLAFIQKQQPTIWLILILINSSNTKEIMDQLLTILRNKILEGKELANLQVVLFNLKNISFNRIELIIKEIKLLSEIINISNIFIPQVKNPMILIQKEKLHMIKK